MRNWWHFAASVFAITSTLAAVGLSFTESSDWAFEVFGAGHVAAYLLMRHALTVERAANKSASRGVG